MKLHLFSPVNSYSIIVPCPSISAAWGAWGPWPGTSSVFKFGASSPTWHLEGSFLPRTCNTVYMQTLTPSLLREKNNLLPVTCPSLYPHSPLRVFTWSYWGKAYSFHSFKNSEARLIIQGPRDWTHKFTGLIQSRICTHISSSPSHSPFHAECYYEIKVLTHVYIFVNVHYYYIYIFS